MDAKATCLEFIEAFNRHDVSSAMNLVAENAELTAPGGPAIRGLVESRKFNENWLRGFPDAKLIVGSILAIGDTVLIEGTFEGTNKGPFLTSMGEVPATGKHVRGAFAQVIKVEKGKFASTHLYYDRMLLAEQMGLLPVPATA